MRHTFGDRVRVKCGATGRYLGTYLGAELALAISAMDNDFLIDSVADGDPHPTLPVPSDDALRAAAEAIHYPLYSRV